VESCRVMKDIEKDKRLLIAKDAFEEEASEGLGRLSRDEAEEDLRDLKRRMERRLRRPRMIWLPAAAAVVILLVASAVYVSLFRERGPELSGGALAEIELTIPDEEVFTDTALIAMAEPVRKSSTTPDLRELRYGEKAAGSVAESKADSKKDLAYANVPPVIVEDDMRALNEVLEVSEGEVVAEEAVPGKVVAQETIPENIVGKAAAAPGKKTATGGVPAGAAAITATGAIAADADVKVQTKPATPAGGYEEFTKWLQENTRYPAGVEPRVRQEIVVAFRVRADSTVYDLKAERTAGDLFTSEAFRLIREGPMWVPALREGQVVEEEVRVTVVFK